MAIEINRIKEIYKGHYAAILDFPTTDILYLLLNNSYKYVWVIDYKWNACTWNSTSFCLFENNMSDVKVRNVKMDFLLETSEFLKLIPHINTNLHLIQVNNIPPYYLDIKRINGKVKYELLKKEADYLFEIELPYNSDYTEIISSDIRFLERVISSLTKA